MSSPLPEMRDRTVSRCSADVNNPIPHSAPSDMVALAHKPDYSVEIPPEIWETLCEPAYSYFLSMDEYRAMSLTCQHFRGIFQPMIFRDVFHDQEGWGSLEEEEKAMAKFVKRLEWLDANPCFMTCVRHCTFYGLSRSRIRAGILGPEYLASYQSMILLLFRLLKGFTGLRQIVLRCINMDERLLSDLASLPMLVSAHFGLGDFTCHSLPSQLITLEYLYIEDGWSWIDLITRPPCQLFSNKRLETLHLTSLKETAECLAHLTLQGPCENLQKLSVTLDGFRDLPTLFRFLATCPRLKSIEISGINLVPIPNHILVSLSTLLPPSALPQLHEYSGPHEIAAMFAPNRPVVSVALLSEPWTNEVWEEKGISTLVQISRSSGPVQKLSLPILPPRPEVLVKITDYFPALKTLRMVLDDQTLYSEEDVDTSDLLPEVKVDEEGTPLSSPNSLRGLVERMCLKQLKLPHSLEYLTIIGHNIHPLYGYQLIYPNKRWITRYEQRRAVCELSKYYPSLSSVALGSDDRRWIKDVCDGLWTDPFDEDIKLNFAEYETMLR